MTPTLWLLTILITAADGPHMAVVPYDNGAKCQLSRTLIVDRAAQMIDVLDVQADCTKEDKG